MTPSFIPRNQAILRDWLCRALLGATVVAGVLILFHPWPYRLVVGSMRVADRASRLPLLLIALCAGYPAEEIALVDSAFDGSEGRIYSVRVLYKSTESGRMTRYRLKLAGWGPRANVNIATVPRAVYSRAEVGQPVRWSFATGSCTCPGSTSSRPEGALPSPAARAGATSRR